MEGIVSAVQVTPEFHRILAIPRRIWTAEDATFLTERLTKLLKTPNGTMELRPIQAIALCEATQMGGLFAPLRVGAGKCVSGDTEIFDLHRGRRTCNESGEFTTVAMKDHGDRGKLVAANASAFSSGSKPCVRLTLSDGSSVTLSTDHPVFTQRGWVQAGTLSNDLVATARTLPEPLTYTEITNDEVIFTAYLLADGVSQTQTNFTNANLAILNEFSVIAEKLADRGVSWFRRKWNINGLRLPASFWCLRLDHVALFLNRFWACNGWIHGDRDVSIILASEKMIDDLRFLLLRLGIHSRKHYKPSKLNGNVFPAWRLNVASHSFERFFSTVGPILGKEEASRKLLSIHRSKKRNTNIDIVPIGRPECSIISGEMGWQGVGGSWQVRKKNPNRRSELSTFLGVTNGQFVSRELFNRACRYFEYKGQFSWLSDSDLFWNRVVKIEHVGILPVYDLNVPAHGSFVGNNIILHNTILSVLVPYCMGAKRPLLLVPAKLKEKTKREIRVLAAHWKIPSFIRIESYELLGRVQAAELFDKYQPDLIILDECHRVKNVKAAVTKRLMRYLHNTECSLVAMSGTVTSRSIRDYAHLIRRCLIQAPVPKSVTELEEWSDALDEIPRSGNRVSPGALVLLCNAEEAAIHKSDQITACRRAYRRRLIETEGVVGTTEAHTGSSLSIKALEPDMSLAVDEAFTQLRTKWELPDGHPLADGLSMWRHARELALGFFYKWEPAAPKEWLERRKKWCQACRYLLGANQRNLDSELQIANAVAAGIYPEKLAIYQAWKAIKDTFEPKTVPVWIDNGALKSVAKWANGGPGIIWTEHSAFAHELVRITGLPYFGKKGIDATGRPIEMASAEETIIASVASNGEGRNLQAWHRNLIVSLPPNGAALEQLLGRTHREGQQADEVEFEYLVTCREHAAAILQAQADARYIEHSTGQAQKLSYADHIPHRTMKLR